MNEDQITYDMRKSYMMDLLDSIKDISDLDYQKKIWVEQLDPNIFDFWEETMCGFFDDLSIDHFLKNLDPKFEFSQNQINKLENFRDCMREYSDFIYDKENKNFFFVIDDEKIVNDPRWHEVAACAQETLKAFEGYRVPTDEELTQA